ncbi:hypothetical protein H312_02222 [Anncaliia algerae PRA339]|uniref:Uncharacterized protein n=1 Tax=Anncaliia algerae PRA339 TaxID=1288291 RepID=A0A059F079_9MICR|nr:hypothetical protein H312_02222 [Anncaliia algerae PRA339]
MEDEKIKKLVQNKKEINNLYHTFHDGTNILHWAAFFNNTELLEKGIKKCDINKIGGIYKSTPIFFGVYNENFKSILILIKNKANLQVVNKIGYNLLHLSAKYDYILCYLLFKCYKVPENQKDFNLNLPMDIALRNSSKKILSHKTNKKRPEGNFLNYITAFFFCYSIIFFNWLVLNVFIFLISRELISKRFNVFIRKVLAVFIFFLFFVEMFMQ